MRAKQAGVLSAGFGHARAAARPSAASLAHTARAARLLGAGLGDATAVHAVAVPITTLHADAGVIVELRVATGGDAAASRIIRAAERVRALNAREQTARRREARAIRHSGA